MDTGSGKANLTTCETMQANTQLSGNEQSSTCIDDDKSNPRTNAIRRLAMLRMKRKAENQDRMVPPPRPRTYKIPVPPTPPARRVNASRVQFLFEKRLKYSDVKEEGRIVIPKALAEKYMPPLESKEGFYMFMDDMITVKNWMFRYRFWPNNSSRIYVLENTGELVKAYGLQIGDFIMVYKDNESQSFAIGTRKSDEVSPNAAHPLPTTKDSLVPYSEESGSTSCPPPNCASSTSTEALATSSEYTGGLKDFPFQLLKVDILDLPEY